MSHIDSSGLRCCLRKHCDGAILTGILWKAFAVSCWLFESSSCIVMSLVSLPLGQCSLAGRSFVHYSPNLHTAQDYQHTLCTWTASIKLLSSLQQNGPNTLDDRTVGVHRIQITAEAMYRSSSSQPQFCHLTYLNFTRIPVMIIDEMLRE